MLLLPKQHFYTVRSGDTVFNIAKRWKLPIESLVTANNLLPPYTIFIGQQLSIPKGATKYQVAQGDSIYRISQKYGVPLSVIIEANNFQAPYTVYPNQVLNIPPGVPFYIVQPGDNLFFIARKFNVITSEFENIELIQQVNQLQSDIIYPGMRLIIPYAPPGELGLIAYNSFHNGTFDIWLYDTSNAAHLQLTYGLAASHTVPFWSPDCEYIAFVGKDLIVHVVHVASGGTAQIDQLAEGGIHTLNWSPDSQRLAYTKENTIVLYNIFSHEARIIREPAPTDVQWFPDATTILFQSTELTGTSQLFRISIDETSIQQLTINQQGRLNYVRLAPNGRFVLYTTPGASISIIYTVDLSTGQVFEIRGGPLAKNYFPEWSKDSSKLVYSATSFNEGYFALIRTAGAKGENERTWAISECFATQVTWSPDNSKLAYLSGCNNEPFASELWYVNLNHPAPIELISGKAITSLSWSPKEIVLPSRTYPNQE